MPYGLADSCSTLKVSPALEWRLKFFIFLPIETLYPLTEPSETKDVGEDLQLSVLKPHFLLLG
jgi:hypothetical protein